MNDDPRVGKRQAHHLNPDRVRQHLQELIDVGNDVENLGKVAGVTTKSLWKILRGDRVGIRRSTEAKVMALPIEPLGRHELPYPTQRRLRALGAIGWSGRTISARTGISRDILRKAAAGGRQRIPKELAQTVKAFYEEVKDTPGGEHRAVTFATDHGFPPPSEWTDDELDDLDPLTTDRVHDRWAKRPRELTDIQRLRQARLDHDYTAKEIADKLGLEHKTYMMYETGRNKPGQKILPLLKEHLGWEPTP